MKDGISLLPTKFKRALVGYEIGSDTTWVMGQGNLSWDRGSFHGSTEQCQNPIGC